VTTAGVHNAVGFNYQRLPAVALMRRMIADGAIGDVRLWRATWLSDEFTNPATPHDWRFDRAMGGTTRSHGILGRPGPVGCGQK
jgi:predicted dehydrogenase